ncbi:MAG: hypothetical protein PHP44_13360 [Kiritimatiellae bacterium]|nr:hypothetical protein [Kiritimatiellia bacterium]
MTLLKTYRMARRMMPTMETIVGRMMLSKWQICGQTSGEKVRVMHCPRTNVEQMFGGHGSGSHFHFSVSFVFSKNTHCPRQRQRLEELVPQRGD